MKRLGLVLLAVVTIAASPFPPQPISLLPRKSDDEVLFQCYAPTARVVYLAGDFNSWASNVDGRITNAEFAMSGPDTNGVWNKTVKLDAGAHHFKFNLGGGKQGWFAPDNVDERDADQNAVIRVDGNNEVLLPTGRNPKWKPRITKYGVTVTCFAPKAHLVYLAGDFNDWGRNRNGLVFDPQYEMRGPDADGVWRTNIVLTVGRHLYQFVIDGDHWVADPNNEHSDPQNHSVLEIK